MKQIHFFFVIFFLYTKVHAQGPSLYMNGPVYISSGALVYVTGNVVGDVNGTLTNNGTITLSSGAIGTSWTDNHAGLGVMDTASTGIVKIAGPQLLTIAGNTTTRFHDVELNNTGGVNLSHDMQVNGILTLTNGVITTNANKVIVADSLVGNYANSWINGNVRRFIPNNANRSFDFPVGTAITNNLLVFSGNGISGMSYLDARFENPKPGTDAGLIAIEPSGGVYTQVLSYGVWHLVPGVLPISGAYSLKLFFNGFSGLVNNSFAPLVRTDTSIKASDWRAPIGTTLNAIGTQGRTVAGNFAARNNIPITKFGQWGIGQSMQVLPLTLVDFSGYENAEQNDLFWKTESEYNMNHFELEKSTDAFLFSLFATVPAENVFDGEQYSAIDDEPFPLTYYRLKIIGDDGTFHYSNIIALNHAMQNSIRLLENPSMHDPVVVITGKEKIEYRTIAVPDASGMYFIIVAEPNSGKRTVLKFIKIL